MAGWLSREMASRSRRLNASIQLCNNSPFSCDIARQNIAHVGWVVSDRFDDGRQSLAHTNAQGGEAVAQAALAQLPGQGSDHPCATASERVADRDGAAVH